MRTFTVNRGTKEQFAFLLDYIGIEPKVVNGTLFDARHGVKHVSFQKKTLGNSSKRLSNSTCAE